MNAEKRFLLYSLPATLFISLSAVIILEWLEEQTFPALIYPPYNFYAILFISLAVNVIAYSVMHWQCRSCRLNQDVNERRNIDQALSKSEDKISSLLENIPDVTWTSTLTGVTTYISSNVEKVYGFTAEEISTGGDSLWFGRIHPEDADRVAESYESLFQGNKVFDVEYRIRKKNGKWMWVHDRAITTYEKDGTRYADGVFSDITERKNAEQKLREEQDKFKAVVDTTSDAIILADGKGAIIYWNKGAEKVFGYDPREVLGKSLTTIMPQKYRDAHSQALERLSMTGKPTMTGRSIELQGLKKSGQEFPIEITLTSWKQDKNIFFGGIIRDISKRRNLEEQLLQSQKMEAIGRLAGGVAHDFNNMLTGILGSSEMLLSSTDSDSPLREDLEEVKKAAKRAASLTSQLLAFSRKQIFHLEITDLNSIIAQTTRFLKRLIGENIELVTELESKLGYANVDRSQIEQIIMNLAVNAKDAMPEGGKIIIETLNVCLDDNYTGLRPNVQPGDYVMLSIRDTGQGMDEKTKARIFEPFFTTKKQGEGTGLGLATVYGIVKQSGGYIWVYSEINKGTIFKIYLPRVEGTIKPVESHHPFSETLRGSETILFVEDEDVVRNSAYRILTKYGYHVTIARNGEEAMKIFKEQNDRINLVITDVVMPGIGGDELIRKLKESRPFLRVLYMSGYADNAIIQNAIQDAGTGFIQKPFSPNALLRKVREIADSPGVHS